MDTRKNITRVIRNIVYRIFKKEDATNCENYRGKMYVF